MNNLTVFNNNQFGAVRTVSIDGNPWFVAADVCRALEIGNPTVAIDRLDEDERAKFNLGRQGETNIVNEPGLYSLVLGSRKPEAKAFKRWITHDVIPSIRKTGFYSTGRGLADRTRLEMEIMGVKAIADHLRLDDASILAMYERLYEDKGLSTSFIPEYADTGNHVAMSLTELLRKNGCDIKSAAFNKMLVADGYLEDRERTSSKKDEDGNVVMKKFKVLTDKGLAYGKNVVSRHNTRETQPLYFEDTFMDLYGKVMG